MAKKINVAVLMGGDSTEREVSLTSGTAVAGAIDTAKYNVTWFDISLGGEAGREGLTGVRWNALISTLLEQQIDVVVPILHGGWGEDGTLQSLLDVAGIPYTGSGQKACAIAIDKPLAKAYGRENGIISPQGVFVDDLADLDGSQIKFPCVVKPAGGGSSVGVAILQPGQEELLVGAVEKALADGSGVLIEEFIQGVEVTCAVLEGTALPVIEIVPVKGDGFYDYEAKYSSGGSDHLIPPVNVDEATQIKVQKTAEKVYRLFGCGGVARADFIITAEGQPYFLEINLLPGMTSTSLVPDAARAVGISFAGVVEKLIQGALTR